MNVNILGIGVGICGIGVIAEAIIFDGGLEIVTTWLVGAVILGFMALASKDQK
jgi:hypothetical protein